jgi:hypothetical protein
MTRTWTREELLKRNTMPEYTNIDIVDLAGSGSPLGFLSIIDGKCKLVLREPGGLTHGTSTLTKVEVCYVTACCVYLSQLLLMC